MKMKIFRNVIYMLAFIIAAALGYAAFTGGGGNCASCCGGAPVESIR